MASLGLTDSLRKLVVRKFATARSNSDLVFSATYVATIRSTSAVPFQLRYCPALAKKPKRDDIERDTAPKPKFDPFENPSGELLVAEIPQSSPSHNLVLNKYPVIENHFILATKANKPQTDLLDFDDITLAYRCLSDWSDTTHAADGHRLYAFFNSGAQSGASQIHRHLQFLPVQDMQTQSDGEWHPLIDLLSSKSDHLPGLPFSHFISGLEPRLQPEEIYKTYLKLLSLAVQATTDARISSHFSGRLASRDPMPPPISYNLGMTTDCMVVMPRRSETSTIIGLPDSSVAINGTILAGTLMVKDEGEFEALKTSPEALDKMLSEIGYPPTESISNL